MRNLAIQLLPVFLLCLPPALSAQTARSTLPVLQPSNVTSFDIDAGLPASCIADATVDQQGRLWLNACYYRSEYQGINFFQYDGYEARVIHFDDPDVNDPGQTVICGVDRNSNLYGFYNNKSRIFRFNPETNVVQNYSLPEDAGNQFQVLFVAADEADRLFIYAFGSGQHTFYRLEGGQIRRLGNLNGTRANNDAYLKYKYLYANGQFWFFNQTSRSTNYNTPDQETTQGALTCFDTRNGSVRTYPVSNLLALIPYGAIYNFELTSLQVDYQGQLIIYFTISEHFFKLDPQTGEVHTFNPFPTNWQISKDTRNVEGMVKDRQGNLLIWRVGAGAKMQALLQDANGKWFDYRPVLQSAMAATRYSSGNVFSAQATDFRKQAIICTEGGLVAVEIQLDKAIKPCMTNLTTRVITEIAPDQFIVNSESFDYPRLFGIEDQAQPKSQLINIQTCAGKTDLQPAITGIADVRMDKNGYIWMASKETGLYQMHMRRGECQFHSIGFNVQRFNFLTDDRLILASTLDNTVYEYDLTQKTVKTLPLNEPIPAKNSIINQIYIARDKTIWIATLEGLWTLDYRSGKSRRVGDSDGFPYRRIMCLHEDEKGRLWIGTFSKGLVIYDPRTGASQVVDEHAGLSNNTVVGILADKAGVCWVATFNGITLVAPEGKVLARLYKSDGLSTNEFNRFSYCKSSSGLLLFGSVAGINVIDPDALKKQILDRPTLRIFLTGINYYDSDRGETVNRTSSLQAGEIIQLPAAARYLHLKFALSSLVQLEENQFAYRIDNGSQRQVDKWNALGKNAELYLNNLPPGKYNILIRGSDYRGVWTSEPLVIPIYVREYFYRQIWFYILLFLFFSSFGLAWTLRERFKRKQLEVIVAQRTRKIQADKQLIEEQAENLKEMDKLKSRFFTNISHEFRTPLTLIIGQIQDVLDTSKVKDSRLQMALRNGKQLLRLINQLLDLSKIDAGQMQLRASRHNIVPLLRYITHSFDSLATQRKIELQFEASAAEITVYFEQDSLEKIMNNLLSNALKFTPEGGRVLVKVEEEGRPGPTEVAILVQDSGIGIPADELPHIFDRFYQLDTSSTREYEGTGVGLALVKELVQLHSGGISLESREGFGAAFTVRLPLGKAHLKPDQIVGKVESTQDEQYDDVEKSGVFPLAHTEDEAPTESSVAADRPLVLVVEDNSDMRIYIRQTLEGKCRILEAADGEAGYTLATEEVPDLIITDVMMPKMDGYALTTVLRNNPATNHIPIIMLTAKAAESDRWEGLESGVDAFITKPFSTRELALRVRKLIENRRQLLAIVRQGPIISASRVMVSSMDQQFLDRLQEVVEAHLSDEQFQVDELCKAMALGRRQLLRKLTALLNCSPSYYLRQVRLERSKQLLEARSGNVTEVALAVGYTNHAAFTRAFHEAFGMAPSQLLK